MAFSAKDVAELRKQTGCGMMECKKIAGMAEVLTERTGIPCIIADDPDSCVAYGCGKSLAWINQMTEGPINVARKRLLNAKTR